MYVFRLDFLKSMSLEIGMKTISDHPSENSPEKRLQQGCVRFGDSYEPPRLVLSILSLTNSDCPEFWICPLDMSLNDSVEKSDEKDGQRCGFGVKTKNVSKMVKISFLAEVDPGGLGCTWI